MEFFSLLEKNEKWFSENDKLKDKIEEYYQEEKPCHGWSAIDTCVYHGNPSIKRFDKSYDSYTRNIFEDAKCYSNYYDRKICFIELKFIFTNFCNCDSSYDSCDSSYDSCDCD